MLALSAFLGTFGATTAKAEGASQDRTNDQLAGKLRLHDDHRLQSSLPYPLIVPETALSANSTLGFGVIRSRPARMDARFYGPASGSRSAAVKFRLRF